MQRVANGAEKKETYRSQYAQINRAIRSEFYFEAVLLEYAIIEDRLVAFLHHAGIVSRDHEELKVNKAVYPYMRKLLHKESDQRINVKNISEKIRIIRTLLALTEHDVSEIEAEIEGLRSLRKKGIVRKGYLIDVYRKINSTVDRERVLLLLNGLDLWRDGRNRLIHAMMGNTAESVNESKVICAQEGIGFARNIDNMLVKPFKKNNTIRKRYNIQ